MKKSILILFVILLVVSLSSCNSSNEIKVKINRLTYSLIDEEDEISSYNYYPSEDREEPIIVEGYKSIQYVKYVGDGFYCFADKGKDTYILYNGKNGTNAMKLPKTIKELHEIFEYKGKALFRTVDEDTYGSYFYIADFSSGKLNIICKTSEAIPDTYFVVSDYIVMSENSASVDMSTSGSTYNYGKISIFDGKKWNSFSGIEPVFYDDTSFLYTKLKTDSDTNGCYKYYIKEKTEEKMTFSYMPYDYDVNNTVFFNIKFLAPETVIQSNDERIITAFNINSQKKSTIKSTKKDLMFYFDVM